jgi:FtsP/CotA-like multicopper oxidase with cupredoxin domain
MVMKIIFHALFLVFVLRAYAEDACQRPEAGAQVHTPTDLFSSGGLLETTLHFRTSIDRYSQTRYCYIDETGAPAPTLRVKPGDSVVLHLENETASPRVGPGGNCNGMPMAPGTTNLHFHGLSIPPVCHQDEVLQTGVAPGEQAFEYRFRIAAGQSPGLYWYHPHVHGSVEEQVLGGASGAMIVEGIERVRPEVAGLPERILILRDQLQPGQQLNYMEPGEEAEKDLSLNFVPIAAPLWTPAIITFDSSQREFWRVLNASADTYFDLQLTDNGRPQLLAVVAMDGAPLKRLLNRTSILLSPGGRAEFIVQASPAAQLVSRRYDTGPDGQANPARVLARLVPGGGDVLPRMPTAGPAVAPANDLTGLQPARERSFYLSEDLSDSEDPKYFITESGAKPKVFDMMSKEPDITVEQGTVEDWIIENRARESHTFHIHQLHFQVMERDGRKMGEPPMLDTIDLPYWDGKGPYPSVSLRMDFRSPAIVGTFPYHCHILEHEDAGMMGTIRVKKP